MKPKVSGVYAITPVVNEHWPVEAVVEASQALLAAGVKWLQLRQKNLPQAQWEHMANQLGRACEGQNAGLILNDVSAPAQWQHLPGVAGVHWGRDDWPSEPVTEDLAKESAQDPATKLGTAPASRPLPPHWMLGASCYNDLELARLRARQGAAYLAFGAVYPSGTKPLAVRACLSLFQQARELGLPTVAIGGITLDVLPELARAGADAVAVVGGLFGDRPSRPEQLERTARQWLDVWATEQAKYTN